MADGSYKTLGEIRVGDSVISHTGASRRVSAVFEQGELECVEITTHSGRVAVAALDHPFMTPQGWVEAAHLRVGQYLVRLLMTGGKNHAASLLADSIISIKRAGLKPCRCLTVATDHTFTVEDLVVHNSIIVSQRFPAYVLGVDPLHRIRLACYNVSKAIDFTKVNLEIMRQPEYIRLFPDPRARVPNVCAADDWSTLARAKEMDAQPSLKALGVASGYIGLGLRHNNY